MKPSIDLGILARGVEGRAVKTGDLIFKAGDTSDDRMYVVKSGAVDIVSGGKTVDTIRENSFFGEMALIDDGPRSATAIAAADGEIVAVGEKQFLFMVEETPHFALTMMRTIVQRLRKANNT
jgi:CRP-like cAMP-binding protein